MRKFLGIVSLVAVMVLAVACGGQTEHKFVGKFTDEFGNQFELRDDHTGTLIMDNMDDKPFEIRWSNGEGELLPYATIMYNGNPAYWYMRDGFLYRHREDMEKGMRAIKIEWED